MVNRKFLWIIFLVLQVSPASSFWLFPESAAGASLTEQRHLRPRRDVDCNKLNQDNTVQDIINGQCTILTAEGTGHYEFKMDGNVQVNAENWNSFASKLQTIIRIHFVFDGSPLTTISFPSLVGVKESQFTIKRNQQLASIEVMLRKEFNALLSILENPKLETVTLAAGSDGLTGSDVRIEGNAQLNTIDMDKLKRIHVKNTVYIGGNGMLREIKMGSLEVFKGTDFELRENNALEKFELPNLGSFEIANITSVAKNDRLSIIHFNTGVSGSTAEIVQNLKLEAIEKLISDDVEKPKNLKIRGNPKLGQSVLDVYNKITIAEIKDIQVAGECIFDEAINNFANLEDCVIINSAVTFTNSTAGPISNPSKLKTINGDVALAGLPFEKVNFLAGITINGTISSDVCDFQLGNHKVDSPKCPSTTATTTTTTESKAPKAAPSGSRNSSGILPDSDKSEANTGGSSKVGIICGAVAGGVILIIIIIILVCCCVPVSAGRGRNDKVKMYKRVLPCYNSKSTNTIGKSTGEKTKTTASKQPKNRKNTSKSTSKGSASSIDTHTATPRSDRLINESRPLLKPEPKPRKPNKAVRTISTISAPTASTTTSRESSEEGNDTRTARCPSVIGCFSDCLGLPSVSARAPTESSRPLPVTRQPSQSRFALFTARSPTAGSTGISATGSVPPAASPWSVTVPQGPERFYVTKDGEVLRQPRINYQRELLNNMEDFFGNEANYEDLEEVKNSKEDKSKEDKSSKDPKGPDQ